MRRLVDESRQKLDSFASDTRGATLVEYAVLMGVVVLLSVQAFSGFGDAVDKTMKAQMLDTAKMGL